MESIISELNLHDSWMTAMRVISKSLTGNVAPVLFEPIGATPETVGIKYYLDIKQECDEREKKNLPPGEKERQLNVMEETWPAIFTMKLLEFYQARLLGPFKNKDAYCNRSRKYCNILLDIVGEAVRGNNFRIITGQFFLMMKEYICFHLPGEKISKDMDFVKVLEECRNRYRQAAPGHKYYVDFDNNTYASGILQLIDELATESAWMKSPHCDYFILASEYLNAFAVYLYMIEFCIYAENKRNNQPAPCLFDELEKHFFDFRKGLAVPKKAPSVVTDHAESLPKNARVYLKDETTGKCYTIPLPGDWTIGRKSESHPDIDIKLETEDMSISRNHARLTLKKNPFRKLVLTICDDLDRLNTTFVWRTPLSNKFHMQLFDGDKLLLGETVFTVYMKY